MDASVYYIIAIDDTKYKPMYEHMLWDLKEEPNCTVISEKSHRNKKRDLLLKRKVIWLTSGKLNSFGYEENELHNVISKISPSYREVRVIFFNSFFYSSPYLTTTLQKYKTKFTNLKYILFYLDISGVAVSRNADYLRSGNIFDLVYTIESNDIKNFKSIKWNTLYSKCRDGMKDDLYDMYFCGAVKGRLDILLQIAEKAKSKNIDLRYDLISSKKQVNINAKQQVFFHDDYCSYEFVLENELVSSCLLEIVQSGQSAMTLRAFEAVVYNKKLLTNCRGILDFQYYDTRYMRFFERIEDIDWDWVSNKTMVDYHYRGEFSPVKLLDDIENRLHGET